MMNFHPLRDNAKDAKQIFYLAFFLFIWPSCIVFLHEPIERKDEPTERKDEPIDVFAETR